MESKHTFIIARNYREEKRLHNIKLKEFIKTVNKRNRDREQQKKQIQSYGKTKMITKGKCQEKTKHQDGLKRQLSLLTQVSIKQTEPVVDWDPFVENLDQREQNIWSGKRDCQQSVTTEDPVLALDSYFTF